MADKGRSHSAKGVEEPLTLETVRQQIEQSILRNVNMTMRIGAMGGVMLAIGLSLMPAQDEHIRHVRIASGILSACLAIVAMIVSKRWGARAAASVFAISALLVCYGLAWVLGTGIASSSGAIPAALIVVMGFVHGPRVGVLMTRLAIAYAITLLGAQWYGLLPGLGPTNTPPVASYAVILIIVFMVIGSTITHFSSLFWNAMSTIDKARQDLQDKVEMQEKTQRELVDSKQRLATLLDHAPMAVLIFDKDSGRLHYVNHHALQAHGAKRSKDIGRHHLFSEAPYDQTTFLEYVHATRDHGALELQWRTVKKDGDFIWWAVKLDTIAIDDMDYVVAFGHDITKRLEAEQALIDHRAHLEEQVKARTAEVLVQQHRLETVIEALPVSLTIKDKQGRYQLSNKVFEEASGLSKDLLLGHTADELFPPSMAEQIRQHDHSLFTGNTMVRYENARMRRDGTQRDHLVTKVPLLDAFGQPEAILTLAVDITEQKTMQRELADAKNEAERLARVKTEFLANMSHEIRTPLHGVLGLAQVGQKCPPGAPQVQQILERITRSGRHLLGVINDILDFSKIDAGKLTIEKCALDPRQLAEDAVAMVEERASAKSLSLNFQCDTIPAAVIGDPLRIRQILINLLSNGVKFTEKGGVTLNLSTSHGKLYFAIKDSGIGMHPEAQERVFSPFEQADGSTSRRFGGTGLGLSISRKLALLMGGDITLQSKLGEGSTFTLVVPLEEADAASLPHPDDAATAAITADTDTPRLSGLRVLAADDVDINREILMGLLTQQHAEVHCAENGKHALQIHKEQGTGYFDIVLMDVQMPVMNGLQATELLLMREPELPIVALTAHAMAEERQRCTDAGMVGHLAKPFDADDMIRLILKHSRRDATVPAPEQASQPASAKPESPPPDSPEQTDQPALDMVGALKRCGGKEALLRKLITRFSEEQADFVIRCQQLLSEDPDQARRVAHMLKGTSANLGLEVLSRHAGDLENALIAQDMPLVSSTLMNLNTALNQHITLLKRWLAEQVPA